MWRLHTAGMDSINFRSAQPTHRFTPIGGSPASANRTDTLTIVDSFEPSSGLPPGSHGMKVEGAVRHAGYNGWINRVETSWNTKAGQAMAELQALESSDLDPGRAREAVQSYTRNQAMGLQVSAGMELEAQTKADTHQSVTNFSLAAGPSVATSALYEKARWGWTPPGPEGPPSDHPLRNGSEQMMRNLASAFDVRPDDLISSDPKVFGPARAKLQQGLIDTTSAAMADPELQKVNGLYAKSVEKYEAQNNSVVVSAGNYGELLQRMQDDNGGQPLQAPAGFYDNALVTSDTTSVGALEVRPGMARIAPYSSKGSQVSMLAPGYAYDGATGTSFSAPMVAGAMQQTHQQFPKMSSAEVERHVQKMRSQQFVDGSYALTL